MKYTHRLWLKTAFKLLCAIVLLFVVPICYFENYNPIATNLLATITGIEIEPDAWNKLDAIVKFCYYFAPFLVLQITLTLLMIGANKLFTLCVGIMVMKRFNGFYRWESSNSTHLLYIDNAQKWGWVGQRLTSIGIGRRQPIIRYWRYNGNRLQTGPTIKFDYGASFEHESMKYLWKSQTLIHKDAIILVGNCKKPTNEAIIFKCHLLPHGDKALLIDVYHRKFSSKDKQVQTETQVYKRLNQTKLSDHENIINKYVLAGFSLSAGLSPVNIVVR